MTKYFIAFVLLALLALENNSFFIRLHAESHPSGDAADISGSIPNQLQPSHRHKTKRVHHSHHPRPPQRPLVGGYGGAEPSASDAELALRHYNMLQRHFQHQRDRERQQRTDYSEDRQRSKRQEVSPKIMNLKMMPRLWHHLLDTEEEESEDEERMYGDSPYVPKSDDMSDDANKIDEPPNELFTSALYKKLVRPRYSYKDEGIGSEEESNPADGNNSAETNHLESNEADAISTPTPMRCPKCESDRKVELITEEELTRLRIEYVKQQILEKLRLKERPNVSAIGLPKPIYEGTTTEQEDEKAKNKDLDDYYARTSKKYIFLQREKRECQRLGVHPSMCFSFKIDDADADGFDVNTAVLWIYKYKQNRGIKRKNTILNQQTIVVSEVQQQLDSKYLPIVKTIAIQSVADQDEWMQIDIEWPIKRWFGNHDLSHLIHISCQSCDISSMDEMISVDKDYRPFIMINTQNRRRASRQKRGINCTDGVTECCREKLYISFDEIGWGDWIIQPRGYDAYFCRGSCGSVASVTQSTSHHSTFVQKVLSTRRRKSGKPLEFIPCCTAKQYSSLQLVFMDSNNTATQKTFPNMVVDSCGCR